MKFHVLYIALVFICMTSLAMAQPVDVNLPDGFTYFPAYPVVTENKSIVVSGTAEPNSIESIKVNGQDVVTTDNFVTWSVTIDLSAGDNPIAIEIEGVNEQSASIVNTVRYHGVISQSSRALSFDGISRLYFNDYLRHQVIIEHDLETGVQTVYGPKEIVGLPQDLELSAADGTFLYLHGYAGEARERVIYKVDRGAKSATLLASNTFPNADVSLNPLAMTLNSSGDTLFVMNSFSLIAINTSTGMKTLITDSDFFTDDDDFSFIWDMCYDETNQRIYYTRRDADFNWGISKIELSGEDALRFQQIPIQSDPNCMVLGKYDSSWGLELNEDEGVLYLAAGGQLLQVDPDVGCLSVVNDYNEIALGGLGDSLQGLAYNAETKEIYLGFFSALASYSLDTKTFSVLEKRGFSNHHYFLSKPVFFAVDPTRDLIYSANEQSFAVHNAYTGQTTQAMTYSDYITSMVLDPASNRLYLAFEENARIGYFDTTAESFSLVDITSNDTNGGLDLDEFTGLVLADDGFLYALNDHAVYRMDTTTGTLVNISPNQTDGIEFFRDNTMEFDTKYNRLLVADYSSDTESMRITSISLDTGARTVLFDDDGPDNDFRVIYGLTLDSSSQSLYFTYSHQVYTLDLTAGSIELFVERSHGDSDLGYLNDLYITDNDILYIADEYVNGFWYINLLTNERTVIQ